jgi:hypothetical protein
MISSPVHHISGMLKKKRGIWKATWGLEHDSSTVSIIRTSSTHSHACVSWSTHLKALAQFLTLLQQQLQLT